MIPRIAQRGHSFKGAGAYYLHDKKAATSERVLWTHTQNLPTNDPEKALLCMAWTDKHSTELKRESGVSLAGREQTAGNVYSYSLAWHTEQQPDKDTMLKAANATLGLLGLSEHEAVIVAHGDTAHAHIHIIANLVHPDTGKIASIKQDQRQLAAWASEYEQIDGKIYCEEREKNARRREASQLTKYQDEKVTDAVKILNLYQQSDSGAAFVAALADEGYVLAKGDKGRLVLVDMEGKAQNLVRQLDGVKRTQVNQKLVDVLENLPSATEVIAQQKIEREQAFVDVTPMELKYHNIQAIEHARIYEQEAISDESEIIRQAETLRETAIQPVSNAHLTGLAQHWERVKHHVLHIAEWMYDKPREYLESWRSKYRSNQEQEEESHQQKEIVR